MFARGEPVRLPRDHRPILLVVVDTEEEFDWGQGFRREKTSVSAIAEIGRFQEVCDAFGIRPTYVVDYPVASKPEGVGPLKEIADAGRATIGAHLHPWVNPPHEEEVSAYHSYPGNLAPDLEARKLRALAGAIEASFGDRPTVYKAGRYGVGPATAALLEHEGFEIDLSVCPRADLGADGGPDFTRFPPEPYWFGDARRLLEIPVTAGFVGFLHRWGRVLHPFAHDPRWSWARLPGVFSRLGALERLRLSPEGMEPDQHRRLTRSLLRHGTRVFTFSFHSPSVKPGCTPYVRDERDRERFLDSCRAYFDFFLDELGGRAMTPHETRAALEAV